jgi:SAM-dependent methyltransferase
VRLDDPEAVRREYATETGLEARRAAYAGATGPDARELVFEEVAEAAPRRFLEVGCGPGELSARVQAELAADVVAVDISPRMVELARARGVDARTGDVQDLPFAACEFDCAVAAWMLYHVPDVDRALGELARVLRPGGRLIAVTNYGDHLKELRELVGAPPRAAGTFPGERAVAIMRRHFARVTVREASGTVTFPDRDAVLAYIRPSRALFGDVDVPALPAPLVVRRRPVILVADKA